MLIALLMICLQPSDQRLAAQVVNFTNYSGVDGLPQSQVFAVLQDRHSFLWLGTYGGLTRFDGVEFRTYARPDGLPSTAVSALAEDHDGRLIVGTLGGGVCAFDRIRFHCLSRKDGLPDQDVIDLLAEPAGGVWVATDEGLAFVDEGMKVRVFGEADGLPGRVVYRLARGSDGVLWAGTDHGLARLEGQRFVPHPAPELQSLEIRIIQAHHGGLVVGNAELLFLVGDRVSRLPGLGPFGRPEFVNAVSDTAGVLWIATRNGLLRHDGHSRKPGRCPPW
jgi:ligand-binding sensor domain-containing protein